MSTLYVSVSDSTMIEKIKVAIEQIRGVSYVSECDSLDTLCCEAYKEAMGDVKEGKVYSATSVDEMFNQILS